MNDNNVNQYPDSSNGYPQTGQQYPQSGVQYPQSEVPYPQTGQQYPQSGAPYPQSGTPYPQSGYPMTGYTEKNSNTWQVVIIAIVAVLIVALATTLIVVMKNRNGMNNMMPPPPPPPYAMNVVPGSVLLNGQTVTFDVIKEDGKTYLPVKAFSSALNYECTVDGNIIKIVSPMEISTLQIDSKDVKIEDRMGGGKTSVVITTEPFENEGEVYIYSRDIALFLKNAYVSYNTQMQIVEMNVGMGGPGGPPPMGGPGQPPPPPPQAQGAQPVQGTQPAPGGAQPAGQAPMGGPGGPPPQQ